MNYNRFAIAAADLPGHWTESSSNAMEYYNAYTGSYAGMGIASSDNDFYFNQDNTYKSKHTSATGSTGNLTTFNLEYSGQYIVSNWEVDLTNRRDGKPDNFDAYFEAVKGGRILHFQKQGTAITYTLFKTQ